MEEFKVSKKELQQMFEKKELKDTDKGWFYKKQEVEIIAIHDIEKKYLQDMMNSEFYKIRPTTSYR